MQYVLQVIGPSGSRAPLLKQPQVHGSGEAIISSTINDVMWFELLDGSLTGKQSNVNEFFTESVENFGITVFLNRFNRLNLKTFLPLCLNIVQSLSRWVRRSSVVGDIGDLQVQCGPDQEPAGGENYCKF